MITSALNESQETKPLLVVEGPRELYAMEESFRCKSLSLDLLATAKKLDLEEDTSLKSQVLIYLIKVMLSERQELLFSKLKSKIVPERLDWARIKELTITLNLYLPAWSAQERHLEIIQWEINHLVIYSPLKERDDRLRYLAARPVENFLLPEKMQETLRHTGWGPRLAYWSKDYVKEVGSLRNQEFIDAIKRRLEARQKLLVLLENSSPELKETIALMPLDLSRIKELIESFQAPLSPEHSELMQKINDLIAGSSQEVDVRLRDLASGPDENFLALHVPPAKEIESPEAKSPYFSLPSYLSFSLSCNIV